MNDLKPGGGNKLQPFIPAGNGEHSGEYTDKDQILPNGHIKNCCIVNVRGRCNFKKSSLVKKVKLVFSRSKTDYIPLKSNPNSVIKIVSNGYVESERYYNEYGEAYLDIDYTDHGNPKTHPYVPHIHQWTKKFGLLKRGKIKEFL